MTAEGDFGERFINLARETRQEGVDLLGKALTALPAGEGRPLDRLISIVGELCGAALDKDQGELARKAFARAWRTAIASGQIPEPYNGLDFPGLIAFTLREQGFLPEREGETRLAIADTPFAPKPPIVSQPAGITNEDLDASANWVREKRGPEKIAETKPPEPLLLPEASAGLAPAATEQPLLPPDIAEDPELSETYRQAVKAGDPARADRLFEAVRKWAGEQNPPVPFNRAAIDLFYNHWQKTPPFYGEG